MCPVLSHLGGQESAGTNDTGLLLTLELVLMELPLPMMGVPPVYIFLIFLSDVTSDWIEIPAISVSKKPNLQNASSLEKLKLSSTPITAVFTKTNETETMSSTLNEHNTKMKAVFTQSLPMVKHPNLKITDSDKAQIVNGTLTEKTPKEKQSMLNNKSQFKNEEVSHDSDFINETLEEAKSDLFNKPNTSLSQKLIYLHEMENEMSAQIKKLSQGLWTERQARGKKLLGFASMEGALMTIAFLTFAVFLVKVVHQFIKGLHDSELAMVALPTAPAIRLSRPKRQHEDLAAAQLLQYMDEFRVNNTRN